MFAPLKCTSIRVIGLHPIAPSSEEIAAVREIWFGNDLVGQALDEANRQAREHFAGLHLIEIEVEPLDSLIEWAAITQPIADKPSSEWQVPWDERSMGGGRWVFFLHFVQVDQPLQTSIGPVAMPAPTPIPARLANVSYVLPG
jgi:hypothetical protein